MSPEETTVAPEEATATEPTPELNPEVTATPEPEAPVVEVDPTAPVSPEPAVEAAPEAPVAQVTSGWVGGHTV